MSINVCKTAPLQFFSCCRLFILFTIGFVLSFTPMQGFCVIPTKGSPTFRYQETASILKKFQSKPYKLTKPERKILRKELKFQSRYKKNGDGTNVGVQIFFLVLLSLAILWGTFLLVLVLAAYEVLPLFLIILIAAIGVSSIILLLIGGSKRIKRKRELNAERLRNQPEPAPIQ